MNQDKTNTQIIDEKLEQIRKDCYERNILPIAIVGLSNNLLDEKINELVYIRYNNIKLPLDYICTGIREIRIYNSSMVDNSMTHVDTFSYRPILKKLEEEAKPKPKSPEPITETKKLNIWERMIEFFKGFYVKG